VSSLSISVGSHSLVAKLEKDLAPATCEVFSRILPFRQKLIQARWSGEAAWIPLGDFDLGVGFENHTSYPSPGQILFYPGGFSETEILFPYGPTRFASKIGQLAGNHFLTVVDGIQLLHVIGHDVVWKGAQDIEFRALS
jgi:hypothetical protein